MGVLTHKDNPHVFVNDKRCIQVLAFVHRNQRLPRRVPKWIIQTLDLTGYIEYKNEVDNKGNLRTVLSSSGHAFLAKV